MWLLDCAFLLLLRVVESVPDQDEGGYISHDSCHREQQLGQPFVCERSDYSPAQTWKMIAPPRLALMTISRLDQFVKLLLRVLEVSENNRLSIETKNVVYALISRLIHARA